MKNIKFYVSALLLVTFLFSCDEDDDNIIVIDDGGDEMVDPTDDGEMGSEPGAYENGFFVSHEGIFNGGFGTVSFLDRDLTRASNDIYQEVNDDNLGGIVQSMTFDEENAYVISNLSNRITVVNRFTFEEVGRIDTGLSNPRYMEIVDGKGYVTNWGDGAIATDDYVAIVDLEAITITSNISVAEGPERILYNGTSLYIAHQGGFSVNNILSIIDPETNAVVNTVETGDGPNSLGLDGSGNLWVLSSGTFSFQGEETGGEVTVFDTVTNTEISSFEFATEEHPSFLNLSGDNAYYSLNGGVFTAATADFSLDTEAIISNAFFYGMDIIGDTLIGCNAGDFNSNGTVEIYDLSDNNLINSINVGLIPAKVYANF